VDIATELVIILVLVLLNGFFAAAEIAVLTARRNRLQSSAEQGSQGAKIALH
jgi:putative hemolysin